MEKATLKIVGNVVDVLEGTVTPDKLQDVSTAYFRFALGAVTFSDQNGLGEAMVIDGISHASWIKEGKLTSRSQSKALTPFLVGIDNNQPDGLLIHQSKSISTQKFYDQLILQYPMGFALAASFMMENFSGTYLKKAPITHENIFAHREIFVSAPENFSKKAICLFGVVIPRLAKKNYPENIIGRAFYHNQSETGSLTFENHTHAALVETIVTADDPKTFLSRLKEFEVEGVRHMLLESVIREGTFLLYPLGSVVAK